jgi:dTDP-4-amino-4,6-dideoxygalactose transaminase
MINVTKAYLPDFEEYVSYLKKIWDKAHLTNDGPLLRELEQQLRDYLGVDQLYFCGNGTIVLQILLKLIEQQGEIITTPFSYVATTNAILWENSKPVFVDIDPKTYCINPDLIEAAITPRTRAIMATHVYGNACDVEAIEQIAQKHNLIVIYDGAHAFGVKLNGKSLLSYGDFSTCSFHATKLFHTVEGGLIVANDAKWHEKLHLLRAFGHRGDDYFFVGINGKNSEFHAAMGLCNLPKVPDLIAARKSVCDLYTSLLDWSGLEKPQWVEGLEQNYAYYPVVFKTHEKMLAVMNVLKQNGVTPRRYFYPSLNKLPFLKDTESCPVSESIASRVICLPLHAEFEHENVIKIAEIINQNL